MSRSVLCALVTAITCFTRRQARAYVYEGLCLGASYVRLEQGVQTVHVCLGASYVHERIQHAPRASAALVTAMKCESSRA